MDVILAINTMSMNVSNQSKWYYSREIFTCGTFAVISSGIVVVTSSVISIVMIIGISTLTLKLQGTICMFYPQNYPFSMQGKKILWNM